MDQDGDPCSHFELYLRGMKEVGADISKITKYVESLDSQYIPEDCRDFVDKNIELALHGSVEEVAASFFYGREKLVPEMFIAMVEVLERENIKAPTFMYYLKRHIEVDGGDQDHGPKASYCLDILTSTEVAQNKARVKAMESLELRKKLWDNTLTSLLAQELVRK